MPEATQSAMTRRPSSTVEILALSDRRVLRLKTWLPATSGGRTPVVLGGRALPATVGEIDSGPARILCLGPAEWLLIATPESGGPDGRKRLEREVSSQGVALVDVSEGLSGFGLQGPAARELLAKGCGVDLHPRRFPAGRCVRTRLAQIPVVIDCLDDSPRYDLYAVRSHGPYLRSWLGDAAVEWTASAP